MTTPKPNKDYDHPQTLQKRGVRACRGKKLQTVFPFPSERGQGIGLEVEKDTQCLIIQTTPLIYNLPLTINN